MWTKIEPNIINSVLALKKDEYLKCVIFANDYSKLKNRFKFDFEPTYYPFLNAFELKLNMQNVLDLARLKEVKYITQSANVSTLIHVANKILHTENASNMANFSTVVIDTGIYPHVDFMMPKIKLIKFVDLINNRENPYDDNGHGTFICGALCGGGTISPKHVGIDPNTNLIVIKALDERGETGAGSILSAMQWVFDNRKQYNIKLVCMSFGSVALGKNDPLMMGAEKLWDSGIVIVSAGGNSGPKPETIMSPGSSYKIITVGALDDDRANDKPNYSGFRVADFSSRGPVLNTYKPDVLASGVNVNGLNNSPNDFYTVMSGTSVSTPIVAGVCSRIIKKYPHFTPDRVKKTLISCCTSINYDRNSEGFGWVDGRKLLDLL